MGFTRSAARLVGGPALTHAATTTTARRPRVLAYHGVPSAKAFAEHLEYLATEFVPVSGRQVSDAWRGGAALPPRAVWLTFDDGDPSVVEHAQPLLGDYGVPATMFVCPGFLDTDEPFWWRIVEAVNTNEVDAPANEVPSGSELLARLKTMPDAARRTEVRRLLTDLDRDRDTPLRQRQLTTEQVRSWLSAGHEVGNHTWDHPLLDRCEPDEQRRQIDEAHERLTGILGQPPDLFAYPNGNWSRVVEERLRVLGYGVAVGFDHRLAHRRQDPLRLSRLRIDATAPVPRLRAIASGLHPTALATYQRLRSPGSVRDDPRRLPRD